MSPVFTDINTVFREKDMFPSLVKRIIRYIGVFPGGKGGRCVRLTTLPPSCAVVMKSGKLNFLENAVLFQACNRIAFAFTYERSNEKLRHHCKTLCINFSIFISKTAQQ